MVFLRIDQSSARTFTSFILILSSIWFLCWDVSEGRPRRVWYGPAVWNEQGFIPAVRLYARQFAARTGLRTKFSASRLRAKLPAHYETAMYKVLQGALANVAAHSRARDVNIVLASRRDAIVMKVEDDGKGFDVPRMLGKPPRS